MQSQQEYIFCCIMYLLLALRYQIPYSLAENAVEFLLPSVGLVLVIAVSHYIKSCH